MKLSRLAVPLALLVTTAFAQTVHTFSFGPLDYNSGSAQFTLIDGNAPNCSIGYCGSIQVRGEYENPWWGMFAPNNNPPNGQGWSFPNGGQLPNNTVTPEPGQLIFDNPGCDLHTLGCTSYRQTTIPFIGYGAGVTVNLTVHYVVTHSRCTRYCDNDSDDFVWYNNSTGGTGTAVYSPPSNPTVAALYRCGSDRKPCLIADGGGPQCPRDLPNCKPVAPRNEDHRRSR